jgi:hypothetical protein
MPWEIPPTIGQQILVMEILLPAAFVLVGLLAYFGPRRFKGGKPDSGKRKP